MRAVLRFLLGQVLAVLAVCAGVAVLILLAFLRAMFIRYLPGWLGVTLVLAFLWAVQCLLLRGER